MNKIIRFFTGLVLVFCMVAGLAAAAPVTAYAADDFVQAYSDMIGQGGYIYYIRTSEKDGSAEIWRMKVADGQSSRVVSEANGIVRLVVCGQQLYYTTANEDAQWEVRTCQLNGEDLKTVCEGIVCCADNEQVFCIRYVTPARARLFVQNLATGKRTSVRTVKEGQTFDYVGNIGNDSYYYLYDSTTDKLYLYRLDASSKKLIRIATEKRVAADAGAPLQVSDVRQIDGELYYDFGSIEGSGGFWYGTIKKLTVDGKKKTVAKQTGDDCIIAGNSELYFSTPKGDYYKYSFKTGKKTKYSLKFEQGIDYNILGDKTYMADLSNPKKIMISRFTSGTDRETLTKNFVTIKFQQKANVSYSVRMKQVGVYTMICVTGMDFTDPSYGWRGRMDSIDWFIIDGAGTLLGSFQ